VRGEESAVASASERSFALAPERSGSFPQPEALPCDI